MFTTKQYRAKAVENGELVKTSIDPNQRRDFQKIEQSFTVLADNEQWLASNYQNSLRASEQEPNAICCPTLRKAARRLTRVSSRVLPALLLRRHGRRSDIDEKL